MKKLLFLLSLLLILPSVVFAEKSYFLVCKDIKATDKEYAINYTQGGYYKEVFDFKKGTLFDASAPGCAYLTKDGRTVMMYDEDRTKLFNEPTELKVYYGIRADGQARGLAWADIASGIWFKSENEISKIIPKGYKKGYYNDELFKKPLDNNFVDIMCSPHSTQFSVDGNAFTDITMKKIEEYLNFVEKNV
ncbi:MAG: hypothetical protein WC373_09820 [Smithella sp.]|jgi:hypothetical protein